MKSVFATVGIAVSLSAGVWLHPSALAKEGAAPEVRPELFRPERAKRAGMGANFHSAVEEEPIMVDTDGDGVPEMAMIGTFHGGLGGASGPRAMIVLYSADGASRRYIHPEGVGSRTFQCALAAARVDGEFRWIIARVEKTGPRVSMHSLDGKRLWDAGPEMNGLQGKMAVAVGDGTTMIVAAAGFFGRADDEEADAGLPSGVVMLLSAAGEVVAQRNCATNGGWIRLAAAKPGETPRIFVSSYGDPLVYRSTAETKGPEEAPPAAEDKPAAAEDLPPPAKTRSTPY